MKCITINKEAKPCIDISLISVTIHLRPWKGRINNIVIIVSRDNLLENIYFKIIQLKNDKKYKRRTVESFTIPQKYKL